MTPIQRNLDWLSRLLFYGSAIHVPFSTPPVVIPVIDVGSDWPQPQSIRSLDYSSIAGARTSTFSPPAGMHWMIDHFSIDGAFAATDEISVYFSSAALDIRIKNATPGAAGVMGVVGAGGDGTDLQPIREKLYVKAPYSILVVHVSVAGGVGFSNRMVIRELPEYQPFPF